MRFNYLLFMLIAIGLSTPVFAEFYQYTDQSGVLRFTDDLSQVPEAQRPKVKKYLEPDDSLTPDQRVQKAQQAAALESMESLESNYSADFNRLDKEKAALDQRYNGLAEEKKALLKVKAGISSETELKAYNEKISDLNKRITAFEAEREVFSKEVDTFNQKFTE